LEKVLYFFGAKTDLLGFFRSQNSFLEIKYAYTIALTLGCLLAGSKGLKASYWLAAG
jgi:hypothetical protein